MAKPLFNQLIKLPRYGVLVWLCILVMSCPARGHIPPILNGNTPVVRVQVVRVQAQQLQQAEPFYIPQQYSDNGFNALLEEFGYLGLVVAIIILVLI